VRVIVPFVGGGLKGSNKTEGVKPKISNRILRICANLQGALREKVLKQGIKRLGCTFISKKFLIS